MAWLSAMAPYLQGAGTVMSVASNERAASSDASQLNYMAGQTRASGQRAAIEERRRATLVDSRVRALAASSGGGVSDPTVMNIRADIGAEGEYRALTQQYGADTQAQSLEYQGQARKVAARGRSISTVLDSANTFASKYGDATVVPKRTFVANSRDLGTAAADYNGTFGSYA